MYLHGGVVQSHRPELLWPPSALAHLPTTIFIGNCLQSVPRNQTIFCLREKKGCASAV